MPTQQVSVEPSPSTLNVTLAAFAAERRRLLQGALQQAIDIFRLHGAPQQTRWPAVVAVDRLDRQTDRRTATLP